MSKVFSSQMIAQAYKDRFGGTQVNAEEVVYWFQELLQQELYRGYPVNLPMVGKFHPKKTIARLGRNPKTGETGIQIPSKFTVRFKPSKKMLDWLAKNRS